MIFWGYFGFYVSVNISGEMSVEHIGYSHSLSCSTLTYCTVLYSSFWCVSVWSCGTSWSNKKIICSAKFSPSPCSTGLCTAPTFGQVSVHTCERIRKHPFSSIRLHLTRYWSELCSVCTHWCLHVCVLFCFSGLIPLCLALTNRDDLLRLRPGVFMILGWG